MKRIVFALAFAMAAGSALAADVLSRNLEGCPGGSCQTRFCSVCCPGGKSPGCSLIRCRCTADQSAVVVEGVGSLLDPV